MDNATQQDKILAYCATHGSITIREAFTELNINSPTKQISNMKKSGLYDVQSVIERRTNKSNDKVWWRRYYIKPIGGDAQ